MAEPGSADAALPDGAALADGAAQADGAAAGGRGPAPVDHRAEPQLGGRAEPMACSPLSPGTEMTMVRLPWVTTSASATPRPLTRCSMIWRAWSRSTGGRLAVGVLGGERHRRAALQVEAELGVGESPVKKTSAYIEG